MSTEKMVVIRFELPNGPYAPGETAGFSRAVADKYLRARVGPKRQRVAVEVEEVEVPSGGLPYVPGTIGVEGAKEAGETGGLYLEKEDHAVRSDLPEDARRSQHEGKDEEPQEKDEELEEKDEEPQEKDEELEEKDEEPQEKEKDDEDDNEELKKATAKGLLERLKLVLSANKEDDDEKKGTDLLPDDEPEEKKDEGEGNMNELVDQLVSDQGTDAPADSTDVGTDDEPDEDKEETE